ncbi:MAG: ATP-binding protein [Bacteroidales bacterium]
MKGPILYIDDEQANLDGLRLSLRKEYDIITADSAEKGLAILDTQVIKVILCDQRMPGITGVEFLEQAMKKYPQLPRILVTGYSDPDAVIMAINTAKIFHYISKPWQLHDLRIVLDNALVQYDLKKENESLIQNLLTTNQELSVAKARAEESDHLKTAFLANMSHEIRTPMNGILGFASLLGDQELEEEKKKMFLNEITGNCHELLFTMENIYNIAMIETKQVKVRPMRFQLNNLLDELEQEFLPACNKKNLFLSVLKNLPDRDCHLSSDPQIIKQVLLQLLHNAVKFTDAGQLEMGYLIVPDEWIFFVKDTGPGIDPPTQEVIFERFKKVEHDPDRLYAGTGLGLAISKAFVELLGGKIWLESEKGKGTHFYFSIPK